MYDAAQNGSTKPLAATEAAGAIAAGLSVLLVDEVAARPYLVWAAEATGAEHMRLVRGFGRGVLKAAIRPEHADRLGLAGAPHAGSVGASTAARSGIEDYAAATLRELAKESASGDDLTHPGHVHPTVATDCESDGPGCLASALVDLMGLAGVPPVAAYVEAAGDDEASWTAIARELNLPTLSYRDLLLYCYRVGPVVAPVVKTGLPTGLGDCTAIGFRGIRSSREFVAFTVGDVRDSGEIVRVHVHRRCGMGDVFGGQPCQCGERMQGAIEEIHRVGAGVILYHGESTAEPCTMTEPEDLTAPSTWLTAGEVCDSIRQLGIERIALSSNGAAHACLLERLGIVVAAEPEIEPAETVLSRAIALAGS